MRYPLGAVHRKSQINNLYLKALRDLRGTNVLVLKEPMGVVLRLGFDLEDFKVYSKLSDRRDSSNELRLNLLRIEYFLAKIKNPVIKTKTLKTTAITFVIKSPLEV